MGPLFVSLLSQGAGAAGEGSFWFPPAASTFASFVDGLYDFILWTAIVFFVLIVGGMVWLIKRYRAGRGVLPESSPSHNTALEVTWTVLPSLILVVFFYLGVIGYVDLRTPPAEAYDVYVTARKWSWQFTYPNGHVDQNLHVPVGRDVRLVMESEDVLHSFFVPAFRTKMDVVPGRYTELWFNAEMAGEYQVFCTEYCGTQHSNMLAKAIVHEPGDFERWMEEASNLLARMSPAEAGEHLYTARGCKQCHSLDGTRGIAPTFKGLFGAQREFADGSRGKADENYLRESILEPQAKVVASYAPVMPTYKGKLKDEELMAIISFIKKLSEEGK